MRAREFIVKEQAASLAVTTPVKAAGKKVIDKGIDTAKNLGKEFVSSPDYAKGTLGNIDRAIDAIGYSQGSNLKADKNYTPIDFVSDQATQRALGTAIKVGGDAGKQALAKKGIEAGVKTWAPRALSIVGNVVKTGTGPVGTALAIGAGHKELGPTDVPRHGPLKGYEINPHTQLPWNKETLAAYNEIYPQDWKPKYDDKGEAIMSKYDKDNPIRTWTRNTLGVELPFGDRRDAITNTKYNPEKYLPRIVNDPLDDIDKSKTKK